MRKYKFTMTTMLWTNSLELIKRDVGKMLFKKKIDLDEIMNGTEVLVEETLMDERDTKTFVKIESNPVEENGR